MNNGNSKKDNILWGLIFVTCGIFYILNKIFHMTIFSSISIPTILLTFLFIWLFINGIQHRNTFEIIFSIAFLAILYSRPLGIVMLSVGNILFAALLLSIGFYLLTKNSNYTNKNFNNNENVFNENDESIIYFSNSLSSTSKYVNTDEFVSANLSTSFGELKVYFDNAIIKNGAADVRVDVSFGHMALYIPTTWKIENNVNASFGSVSEKNNSNTSGSPVLRLYGNVSFGELSIFYI